MYTTFERFEIQMTKAQALRGSHPGPCDEDIRDLLTVPAIARQFKKIPPKAIKAELYEYGAWEEEELSDEQLNKARILWIAAGNIREELYEKSK